MDQNKKMQTELNDFLVRHGMSRNDLSAYLKDMSKQDYEKRMQMQVEKNSDLVGRFFVHKVSHPMFPEMNRYYRVVSNRCENEYRVSCLAFDEHPTYWFRYRSSKIGQPGDYYLGHYEFESFDVECMMADDIRSMCEITSVEYQKAAEAYLHELMEMQFPADHYRAGNKLPSDPSWETHPNRF